MALKVKCSYSDINCTWTGELVDFLKVHMKCIVSIYWIRKGNFNDIRVTFPDS